MRLVLLVAATVLCAAAALGVSVAAVSLFPLGVACGFAAFAVR